MIGKQYGEGRFDNVNLGRPGLQQQIAAARRSMAENLEVMIADEELRLDMTLEEVIRHLRQTS